VHVAFGDSEESHNGVLARLTVDTRTDPAFPRNALVGRVGWERLGFAGRPPVHRLSGRAQAFLGVVGPAVVAVSAGLDRATAPVPPYEQRLLGGGRSVRGLRAGAFAGDSLALASLELRVPVTSPLSIGRVGLKAFADAGTVWDAGERLVKQRWHRGAGGGVFVTWTALVAGLDVAGGEGGVRVHALLRFGDPRSW
jgi:outer membrane protein assembly factor BamA